MSKGEQTREAILREALAQSSHVGLQGITVGMLAEKLNMSKSGLFAHFRSKEQLQTDVLLFAAEHFRRVVLLPALRQPRGLPRLTRLFETWSGWDGYADFALPGGCIFVTVAREYDDEPDGPIRDLIVRQQRDWLDSIAIVVRGAISEGHFAPTTDPERFAHDLLAVMLGYHFAARLLRDPQATDRARCSFQRLVEEARTPASNQVQR
ncbi:TetR/AcrR family transcriptional regulator [Nakamurella lactea]|uniref:TetR/AcrR family transcriptional regulator n=1 Tax=Nakamurella lactea TaxID=459515 RepID=UPI00041F9C2C|nr:TetR/AcrR family transcriptional regulator [Nakamurella lactea]